MKALLLLHRFSQHPIHDQLPVYQEVCSALLKSAKQVLGICIAVLREDNN